MRRLRRLDCLDTRNYRRSACSVCCVIFEAARLDSGVESNLWLYVSISQCQGKDCFQHLQFEWASKHIAVNQRNTKPEGPR